MIPTSIPKMVRDSAALSQDVVTHQKQFGPKMPTLMFVHERLVVDLPVLCHFCEPHHSILISLSIRIRGAHLGPEWVAVTGVLLCVSCPMPRFASLRKSRPRWAIVSSFSNLAFSVSNHALLKFLGHPNLAMRGRVIARKERREPRQNLLLKNVAAFVRSHCRLVLPQTH